MKQCDVPCSVEYEEPHGRAQRRGKELVLEARKMRVEPGAFGSVLFIKGARPRRARYILWFPAIVEGEWEEVFVIVDAWSPDT